MTDRINKLIAELEARLAVCEAATDPPWVMCWYDGGMQMKGVYDAVFSAFAEGMGEINCDSPSEEDATFITASRNQRPAELRALLTILRYFYTDAGLERGAERCKETSMDIGENLAAAIADALELP